MEPGAIAARAALESQYRGLATVIEYDNVTAGDHLTKSIEKKVLENQACKLSYETVKQADQTEAAANVTQVVKLFVSPDVSIRPGSKITVTQAGVTADYTYSGVPAVYPTHQEIVLELYEGRA